MWTRAILERRLQENGLQGGCWGRLGSAAVRKLEGELGRELEREIRDFAENVGNLLVDPFNVVITGNDGAGMTCVSETRNLHIEKPGLDERVVKIMDHAGESYLFLEESGAVEAFDSFCVVAGQATQRFVDFGSFLEWVFAEALQFQRGTDGFQS